MRRVRSWLFAAALAACCLFAPASPSQTRSSAKPTPAPAPVPRTRLVPVAETKLLMDGIAKPNFDGLVRALRQKPAEAEAWGFLRGQALLIAEGGNLLMLRPPKTRAAQDRWMARAAELRAAGVRVARAAAEKDYVGARAGLADLANVCNRCHESFGVRERANPTRVPD
jgi:hypothetical protein